MKKSFDLKKSIFEKKNLCYSPGTYGFPQKMLAHSVQLFGSLHN